MHEHLSRVREAHPTRIKGSVPKGRQEKAIVNIEMLGVVLAVRPAHASVQIAFLLASQLLPN